MGRPKGAKNKVVETIPQENVGVASVETVMDVEIVSNKKESSEFIPSRRDVRGEFKRANPLPKVVYPATFECYEAHVTRGASSYTSVPCCICGMESNLKSIQKEFIQ